MEVVDPEDESSLSDIDLRTEDISLIFHTHGRQRGAQRNIKREELQAAIKYGKKEVEVANPERNGSKRWKYTHDGVVFITDETSRHELTSWRLDGKDDEEDECIAPTLLQLGGSEFHAVLIVDHSGSMQKRDVPGYNNRSHAVYECLKKEFVEQQLESGGVNDVVVTLISMSDKATVLHRKPMYCHLLGH